MRNHLKYLGILSIFGTAIVVADDAKAPPAGTPTAKPSTTLSVGEMKTESARMMSDVTNVMRYVLHLKEVAKKQKDLLKLNCLNDKLIKLKAQTNLTETTNAELQAALDAPSDERFAIYVRLTEDQTAVTNLKEEANACVGQTELYKQEAGVTVDRPVVPDDPTKMDPFFEDVEPPGYASPFN